ncbi:unnamed protein product [Trifolium pratense]|uniref:Uncharacterized protein n=1 Tax=Trifolium pratense TaxID=57577 RepID=A0ACB0JGL1_TRIPR|nr:unnamed protein product [Trifolium pratense]
MGLVYSPHNCLPNGKPCVETKEFNLLHNMLEAVVEERYQDADKFFLGTSFKLGCMFHKITFLMDCNIDWTSKVTILMSHVSDATLALWRDKLNQFKKKANNRSWTL